MNLVARQTESEWTAAANADIALEHGALPALLAAGSDPRVGAAAPRLVLPDGTTQHSVHHFPTLPFTLAFNLGLRRVGGRLGDHLCLEDQWNPERARAVDWALGALLLLRRQAFDAVGGFDEAQWMYAEDLDLAWRLGEAGWITRYVPSARALHAESAATTVAFGDERAFRFMAATYRVLARRRGRLYAWTTALINFVSVGTRLMVSIPLARLAAAAGAPGATSTAAGSDAHRQAMRWRYER